MALVTMEYSPNVSLGAGKYNVKLVGSFNSIAKSIGFANVLELASTVRSTVWRSGGFCSVYLFPFHLLASLNVSYCVSVYS